MTTPQILVGCWSSYNSGVHHNTGYIDATDPDEVWEEIEKMLRSSPHPNTTVPCEDCEGIRCCAHCEKPLEGDCCLGCGAMYEPSTVLCTACKDRGKIPTAEDWGIFDCSDFGPYEVGESADIEKVCRAGRLLEEHGDGFKAALAVADTLDEAEELFQDSYRGVHDSEKDFAQEWAEECEHEALAAMPERLRNCIDWESYARDNMEIHSVRLGYQLHIFC